MFLRVTRLAFLLGVAVAPLAGCYVQPAYVARPVYVRPAPPPAVVIRP